MHAKRIVARTLWGPMITKQWNILNIFPWYEFQQVAWKYEWHLARSIYLVHCRDDLARAIKKLHVMGSGFQILPVGNKQLVQSVPGELSMDHTAALQLAQVLSWTCWKHYNPSVDFTLLDVKISEKRIGPSNREDFLQLSLLLFAQMEEHQYHSSLDAFCNFDFPIMNFQNIFQGNGYTSVSAIMKDLGWEADRTKRILVSYKH